MNSQGVRVLPQQQVKWCDVMQRPISIAMAISVVIHLAALMAVEWMLSDKADAAISNAVLLVIIQPPEAQEGFSANEQHVAAAATSEAAIPERIREAARASDQRAKSVDATETVVAAESSPDNLNTATAAASSEKQAAVDREQVAEEIEVAAVREDTVVAPSDVVTTVALAEPVASGRTSKTARPASVQAPLSPKQEKMLQRRITAWTENLDRVPEAAAGLTWRYKGQEYLAKFTQLHAEDGMSMQRVIVEVSTEEDGKRLSTQLRMKRLAFSNYAQFVNRWDPDVQFHNDELDGRFHSNSEINLTYSRKVSPLFHGKVTTTARRINVTNSRGYIRRDQIFSGGLQTGARVIRLPKHFLPFPGEAEVADDQVHHFDQDARITFYADGSYDWQVIGSESPQKKAAISKDVSYLIAARKVKLYVKGTVNGKVLVYSPERIVIDGDLVYEQDPEAVPDADDYLGLVSDKYVDIAPPDVTGPGDLVINAAIYAKRRFAVRGYRFRNEALLDIYGSLSAGSLSATEPRYYTRIRFDERLEELRPPGFPMTDRFEVESPAINI
ncbi:MAG: hypothetical protein ACYSUD_14335 [Planctomycetota bacterium]